MRPMIDTDTNTLNIGGKDGGAFSAGENVQIPSNFPADFPRYPGAKVTLAYIENQGKASTLMQETSDALEQAQAKVKEQLEGQGFTQDNVMSSADIVILSFSKGTVKYQANITRQDGKTMVQPVRVEQ